VLPAILNGLIYMGTSMAHVLVAIGVALGVAAAVLEFTSKRGLSGWLLVPFPALMCGAGLLDLSRGAEKIGRAAFESDLKQLAYLFFLLLLSVFAALRPNARWLFWIAWAFSAVVCGALVYLAFFWHVFS
jgi:hypothetical protein